MTNELPPLQFSHLLFRLIWSLCPVVYILYCTLLVYLYAPNLSNWNTLRDNRLWYLHSPQLHDPSSGLRYSGWLIDLFIVLRATFSNISALSWQPVLVMEEADLPGENHMGKQLINFITCGSESSAPYFCNLQSRALTNVVLVIRLH